MKQKERDEDERAEAEGAEESCGEEADEPDFSDPPDYRDTISDEELLGDLLEQRPREADGLESLVVVDGLPQVGPDRLAKLQTVIGRLFGRFGEIKNSHYPTKPDSEETTGYAFLEYSSPAQASEAVALANNTKLDKNFTMLVNKYSDFDKYRRVPEQWEPPAPQTYSAASAFDLYYYLTEPDAFDQYCVGIASQSGVSLQIWQNSLPEPTLLQDRPEWTETYAVWSPLGTYLATFHWRGVALWAGPKFAQFQKFSHPYARFLNFSPMENYLVTFCPNQDRQDDKKIIIWDIRTGQEKRSFAPIDDCAWPIYRWSKDDKYFACMGPDTLSVYQTPGFGLLDKKSIKQPGIRDFAWSPTDNVIAFWVSEDKDVPARVILLDIPSRVEVRSKNLFNVADCKIHWQKSGDYLCVKVDRYSKIRKDKTDVKYSGLCYNFEIFHMREKDLPVDSIEIKESIHAFSWEPTGSKFAIVHGDMSNTCISFYCVNAGQPPTLLKKFEKKPFNHLFWSPSGQFVVLANLGVTGGALEFLDTADFTVMNTNDHYQMSGIEWDPTGRYVVTGVSSLKCKIDCGYYVWSFQGKILRRVQKEGFSHFSWRPRPPTPLSIAQQKEIQKNLKKYSPQFESKDRSRLTKASKELIAKRGELMNKFKEYRASKERQWREQKQRRLELRNYVDTDELDSDTNNMGEETVEFIIKEETFPCE